MEEIKEEWRAIPGYEDYYEVSNFGRVKSLDRIVPNGDGAKRLKGRILKISSHYKSGYQSVMLSKYLSQKRFLVHRLVAQAFIPNPENMPEVNHKDENKANNQVSNLEWCTHLYNNRYGTKKQRLAKARSKPVEQRLNGELIARWPSATIAAQCVNGTQSGVSGCCNGLYPLYKGYSWVYV